MISLEINNLNITQYIYIYGITLIVHDRGGKGYTGYRPSNAYFHQIRECRF